MFHNKRMIFGAFIALLIMLGSAGTQTRAVHADVGDLEFALDCDLQTAGVQSACSVAIGTPRLDIGVTVRKVTAGDSDVQSFQFAVTGEQQKFNPRAGVDSDLNANPDYNEGLGIAAPACTPPPPQRDTNVSAMIARSFATCFDTGAGPYPTLAGEGSALLLGVVHYDLAITGTGSAAFDLGDALVYDGAAEITGDCTANSAVPAECIGATVTVFDPLLAPGVIWTADCDLGLPGVQDVCGVLLGTATKDVGTVVVKNGGGDKKVTAIYMEVLTDQLVLNPQPNPVPHVDRDANPDWNQAPFLAAQAPAGDAWACSPFYPIPDGDPDPAIATSSISCFNANEPGSPVLQDDGTPLLTYTVHYNVAASSPTMAVFSFNQAEIDDENFVPLGACAYTPVVPCYPATVYITGSLFNTDGDTRNNVIDNCIEIANDGQANNDRIVDLPPSKAFDDFTRLHGDNYGDVCDADDDNDGLRDGRESEGSPCLTASAATDPMKSDTDGDRAFDGAECLLGFDPASAASTPPFVFPMVIDMDRDGVPDAIEPSLGMDPADVDTDNDTVNDGVELKYYNGNAANPDTDGDGCNDGKEVASVNADNVVNAIDLGQVASAFGNVGAPQYLVEFDMNKDGSISSLDLGRVAVQFGSC